jgi:hypothetical protein
MQLQNIIPEGEWDQFMDILSKSLPTAFRITGCRAQAQALIHIIESKLIQDVILAGKEDKEIREPFTAFPLPW